MPKRGSDEICYLSERWAHSSKKMLLDEASSVLQEESNPYFHFTYFCEVYMK